MTISPNQTPLSERVQAIIEHRRMMKAQRQWEAVNRERLDAEWDALPDGRPWTIADHIAGAKLP